MSKGNPHALPIGGFLLEVAGAATTAYTLTCS